MARLDMYQIVTLDPVLGCVSVSVFFGYLVQYYVPMLSPDAFPALSKPQNLVRVVHPTHVHIMCAEISVKP